MSTGWQPPDPLAQIPVSTAAGQAGFLADVQWAWQVCLRQPLLPLISLVLGLALLVPADGGSDGGSSAQQSVGFLVSLVVLATIGFNGTQRLWFLRAATARTVTAGEVLPLTFRYFGRFFVLGLVFLGVGMAVLIPLVLLLLLATGDVTTWTAPTVALIAVGAVFTITMDVLFTFVTPAIVLSSHRVRDALRIGLRMLRATWPMASAYVFVPPFAAVLLTSYSDLRPAVAIPLVVLSTFVNLLVKGATVAYYLRLVPPVGVDGALIVREPWRMEYLPDR